MSGMKLSDWSQVANIVGAVTVVVSLVFVGLQVRDNTNALRSQNQRALVNALEQLEVIRVQDEAFAELMLRAESGQPLSAVDEYRLEIMVYLYLNNWEQALHDYQRGLMEDTIWNALDSWLRSQMRFAYFHDTVKKAAEAGTYSRSFERHLLEEVLPAGRHAEPARG